MTTADSNVSTNTTQQSVAESLPLTCNEITGIFSMIGNGPIVIDATPGLALHVRSGLVQICHPDPEGQQLVQGGQTIVLDRTGPVELAAIERAEVRLDWPVSRAYRATTVQQQYPQFAYA